MKKLLLTVVLGLCTLAGFSQAKFVTILFSATTILSAVFQPIK